jgi:hypothetical protein
MQKTIFKLDQLQSLINLEKEKYKQAIKTDQKFEEVKLIYLKIKDLENKADNLMKEAHSKLTK